MGEKRGTPGPRHCPLSLVFCAEREQDGSKPSGDHPSPSQIVYPSPAVDYGLLE